MTCLEPFPLIPTAAHSLGPRSCLPGPHRSCWAQPAGQRSGTGTSWTSGAEGTRACRAKLLRPRLRGRPWLRTAATTAAEPSPASRDRPALQCSALARWRHRLLRGARPRPLPSIPLPSSILPCPSCCFPVLRFPLVRVSPSSILGSPTGPDPSTAPPAPVEAAGEVSRACRAAGPPLAVRPRAAVGAGRAAPARRMPPSGKAAGLWARGFMKRTEERSISPRFEALFFVRLGHI